jgi:diguanylate cyclase (GGDEF)-like protein
MLLIENSALYIHIIRLRESDRQKAAELHRLSVVDLLTGIANRRAFDETLDQEWRRAMRHNTELSLVLIDVDYFKQFNDTYGHLAGDQCLRTVAQVLAAGMRRAGELAARYGGEEFAVLLPHTDLEQAHRVAERMCAAVREEAIAHAGSEVSPHVTISVGVASTACIVGRPARWLRKGVLAGVLHAERVDLVKAADSALYLAKSTGRNRVVSALNDPSNAAAKSSPAHAA